MVPAPAADGRLARILLLIPLAARDEGIELDELAERLGVTREQVLKDIEEVVAREYYHPAGSPIDVQVLIEGDRVTIWTSGEFLRPPRLSTAESLALTLGLRLLADGAGTERRAGLLDFARRVDEQLAVAPAAEAAEQYALEAGDPEGGGVLDLLREAAQARQPCRIEYLKPGEAPEERRVHPYALVFAHGLWYLLGWSEERAAVRTFRLDRILTVTLADGAFEVPSDFRVEEYVEDGIVFRAEGSLEAAVRYAPRIAKWFRERGEGVEEPDGSVVCRYQVADPGWLVRHALWYGPDAEVLEPAAMREAVGEVLERIVSSGGSSPGGRLTPAAIRPIVPR